MGRLHPCSFSQPQKIIASDVEAHDEARDEAHDDLAELTAALDYRQRWVIERLAAGEKAAAIAAEMGATPAAVRQIRRRAVRAMREAIVTDME